MSHGINDNVLHRWRQLTRQREATQRGDVLSADGPGPEQFVALTLPAPGAMEAKAEVRLEVRRAAVTVSVAWPEHALGNLAGFVHELLK